MRTAARTISTREYGPVPRTIGIGPISITAPPLKIPLEPANDPTVISSVPTTIIAKAMKNNQVARENDETACGCARGGLDFATQLEQDHREGSKQLLQTVWAQD